MKTLADVLSMINAIDNISIHDGQGNVRFNGLCSDFRPLASEEDRELLNAEVDRIRAYKGIIVLLLK